MWSTLLILLAGPVLKMASDALMAHFAARRGLGVRVS